MIYNKAWRKQFSKERRRKELINSSIAMLGMVGAVWGVINGRFLILLIGFFLLSGACVMIFKEMLKRLNY